ncbi:hypothetical protein H671_2g5762 [Cricetulus griseus]|uniref:Uncharacterized protein n=1 Tax=Cricetulus griseus TaxID=10029 RepID=A0A061IEU0_CRIGR|nr:hypothetical protein H671_2g5762 [Cricetulus griseus]
MDGLWLLPSYDLERTLENGTRDAEKKIWILGAGEMSRSTLLFKRTWVQFPAPPWQLTTDYELRFFA